MVTLDQLVKIMPAARPRAGMFIDALNAAMEEFEINREQRIEQFLAQLAHESGQLGGLVESLNYSAEGLVRTWPSRFDMARAIRFARRPEAIANTVYANRLGNGDEASGDGWKYIGRGGIGITGRHNYIKCMMALEIDCVEHPELLESPEGACRSAAWFWWAHGLNEVADSGDFQRTTKIINGGLIGESARIGHWMVAKEVIS